MISELDIMTIEYQRTTDKEKERGVLPIAKRLMCIEPLEGISNREKEERARSFFSLDINFSPYLELPRIDGVVVNEYDPVWKETRNLSMPYTAAVLTRWNNETWKQYLLDPRKGGTGRISIIC